MWVQASGRCLSLVLHLPSQDSVYQHRPERLERKVLGVGRARVTHSVFIGKGKGREEKGKGVFWLGHRLIRSSGEHWPLSQISVGGGEVVGDGGRRWNKYVPGPSPGRRTTSAALFSTVARPYPAFNSPRLIHNYPSSTLALLFL